MIKKILFWFFKIVTIPLQLMVWLVLWACDDSTEHKEENKKLRDKIEVLEKQIDDMRSRLV